MATIVVAREEFDGTQVEVRGEAYHHLFRVRRMAAGSAVRVVDGEGRARAGVVGRIERSSAVVNLGGGVESLEPRRRVELWVGPPKPDRAAWLVEKGTEIGVSAIRFVGTAYAARGERRGFGAGQVARLRRVAIAAVEQCGRARVPEIEGVEPLEEMLERLGRGGGGDTAGNDGGLRAVVLDAAGGRAGGPAGAEQVGGLVILVGPEGGWAREEMERFERLGLQRWSLGERTLRVETAALAAATLALLT